MILLSDTPWYDPAWIAVYVAVLAIIIAVVSTIIVYRKQQSRKEISFGVVSANSLLSVSEEVKSKVQVLYEGKPVSNVRLIILRVWNSGNQPIEAQDFENNNPIKFDFGSSSEILDLQVKEMVPVNLKAKLVNNQDNFILEPFLLNKGDSLTIKALLSSSVEEIIVDTRIIGAEQIIVSRETAEAYKLLQGVAKGVASGALAVVPGTDSIVSPLVDVIFRQFLRNRLLKKQYASNIRSPFSLDIKDKPE